MNDNSATGAHKQCARFSMWLCLLLWPIGVNAVERGDVAPDFTLPVLANPTATQALDANGNDSRFALLKLSDYLGKVVYLDFWQSACVPCRESLPLLSQHREEFASHGVEILAVNTDANPRDALNFVAKYPVNYPVLSDPTAQIAQMYGLTGLPTAYLIARDGRIEGVHEGFERQDFAQIRTRLIALSDEMRDEKRPAMKLPASITMIGD